MTDDKKPPPKLDLGWLKPMPRSLGVRFRIERNTRAPGVVSVVPVRKAPADPKK